MKLTLALLAASALSASGFGVAPVAFTSVSRSARSSVVLEASRNQQKIASRSAWAESRGVSAAGSTAEANAAGLMTGDEGLEYVKLVHPSGSSAEVYLLGGVVTSYKDADGTEFIAVRPDAKMDGSKPISGGLSHCWPQVSSHFVLQHFPCCHRSYTVFRLLCDLSLDLVRFNSMDSPGT